MGRRSTWSAAAICAVALIASVSIGTAAQAATPPTGDAATIAFYKTMVQKTLSYGTLVERQTGYAALQTAGRSANWTYGEGVPLGYAPATEDIVVAAAGGRLTWVMDTMTPRCGGASCTTVQMLLDPSGAFLKILTGRYRASCWSAAHGDVAGYSRTGVPSGYGLYGRFLPMKRVGANELVTSTYAFGVGRTATELDTISLATDLPTKGLVHVGRTTTQRAFSYSFSDQWLKPERTQPHVTLCNG